MVSTLPNGNHLILGIPETTVGDLTPEGSPSNSPMMGRRVRNESISNPEPVIKMVAEALIRKGMALEVHLEDRQLISILEDAKGAVEPTYQSKCRAFSRGVGKGSLLFGEVLVFPPFLSCMVYNNCWVFFVRFFVVVFFW